MEIFKLFGSIGIKNKDANKAIDETTGKAESASGKIISTFKKMAGVLGTLFAGKAIFDFGKGAVEAAASAKAIKAQFESVFGELVPQATDTVNKMAKGMGILPERLNPMFTKLSAKYKGLGASTEEAMNLAARGTTIAADAAAFYDKSLEDTSSALNSFINGNYEGGEAIGLFANETQMASWASEKLGINWKDLDEKGKQVVRLQFAEAMQEAAGATGQASKEADGYENVMGNLHAAWDKFKALVGGPLLEPVVNGLMGAVDWLQKAGDWVSQLQEKLKDNGAFEAFGNAFDNIKETISIIAESIGDFIANLLGLDQSKDSVEQVAEAIKKVGEFLESSTGAIKDFVDWLDSGTPAADAFQGVIAGIGTAFASWKIASLLTELGGISGILSTVGGAVTAFAGTVTAAIGSIPIIGWIAAVVAALVWFFTQTETGKQIWQDFMDFLSNLWNAIVALAPIIWQTIVDFFANLWDGIKTKAEDVWNAIVDWLTGIWNSISATASSVFSAVASFFGSIWQSISDTISNIWDSITSFLSGLWEGIKTNASTIFNGIKDAIETAFNTVSDTASRVWEGVQTTISTAIDNAKNAVSSAIEAIKGLFNFEFKWPHIPLPHFSISGSANPLDWLSGGLPSIGVEWYAKGGIMTSPTLFGMNGNNAMVGGEAGDEAVLPLNDKTLRPIGQQIADSAGLNRYDTTAFFERIIELLEQLLSKNTDLYIDREKISQIIYEEFGIIARREV